MLPKPDRARPTAICWHPSIRRPLPKRELRKPKISWASTRESVATCRLTGLGFDTKVNGRFDEATRAVITRWQSAHGYPKTGFLNTPQHEALLTESVAGAHASLRSSGKSDDDRPGRRRGGDHHHRSAGGPGGLIGGVVGGLFGRR
jgi:hypothetical protein